MDFCSKEVNYLQTSAILSLKSSKVRQPWLQKAQGDVKIRSLTENAAVDDVKSRRFMKNAAVFDVKCRSPWRQMTHAEDSIKGGCTRQPASSRLATEPLTYTCQKSEKKKEILRNSTWAVIHAQRKQAALIPVRVKYANFSFFPYFPFKPNILASATLSMHFSFLAIAFLSPSFSLFWTDNSSCANFFTFIDHANQLNPYLPLLLRILYFKQIPR